jgi:hypothetical protein
MRARANRVNGHAVNPKWHTRETLEESNWVRVGESAMAYATYRRSGSGQRTLGDPDDGL